MKEFYLIDSLIDIENVFGSLKILDKTEPFDQIQIIKFAKVVSNYIKMTNILNESQYPQI